MWQDWQVIITGEDSAIYGCGCNSCGCNLKLSGVRWGSFGVDVGHNRRITTAALDDREVFVDRNTATDTQTLR